MNKYLATGLLIVTFVLGTGTGYMISPQYAMNRYETSQVMDLGKADKYFDLRYINSMISHHREAMALANQIKDISKRQEIKDLAKEILASEPKAIDNLYQWKKDWYQDSSIVADKEVANLGSFDEKLDLRFLNALIAHHEAGIEMAMDAEKKSTRNDILNNADAVINFLESGVIKFKEWRTEWYKVL